MSDSSQLRKTPLHALHLQLGGRMVEFGGWDMPVQYSGIKDEHTATRTSAGLFDVSHMGEIEVRGPQALAQVQKVTPNDASKLTPGRAQYSALTTEQGTFVDDILVYCRGAEDFLLVVNASNADKDYAWLQQHQVDGAELRNVSEDIVQIAIQGPRAQAILQRLVVDQKLEDIGYYRFAITAVAGLADCLVSRTGYTGEDGFEIYLPAAGGPTLWSRLLEVGAADGLKPCGLGARDTLRLEAKLPLYGNDIDTTTTVVEADLAWIIKPSKGDFIGRDVLVEQKANGAPRRLVGFSMVDRGVPRHGHPTRIDGVTAGVVTSGGYAPHLDQNIGLTYLPTDRSAPGTEFEVEIRGKGVRARVVETPFVPHNTRNKK